MGVTDESCGRIDKAEGWALSIGATDGQQPETSGINRVGVGGGPFVGGVDQGGMGRTQTFGTLIYQSNAGTGHRPNQNNQSHQPKLATADSVFRGSQCRHGGLEAFLCRQMVQSFGSLTQPTPGYHSFFSDFWIVFFDEKPDQSVGLLR
jgi:hypothetical protein